MTLVRRGPLTAAPLLAAALVAGCAPSAEVGPPSELGDDTPGVDGEPSDEQPDDTAADDRDDERDDGESDRQAEDRTDDARSADDGTPSGDRTDDERSAQRDDDGDTWTFGDGDGTGTSGSPTELPEEIDAVMDVPDSFEQYSRAEASTTGHRQITVQGEVTGSRDELLTRIEDGMRAAGWDRIELDDLVEDRPILRAEDGDHELEVTVSVADGDDEGALTISYRFPE